MEFVSWDDDNSQYDGKNNPNVPNHQPEYVAYAYFSPKIAIYTEQPTGSEYTLW